MIALASPRASNQGAISDFHYRCKKDPGGRNVVAGPESGKSFSITGCSDVRKLLVPFVPASLGRSGKASKRGRPTKSSRIRITTARWVAFPATRSNAAVPTCARAVRRRALEGMQKAKIEWRHRHRITRERHRTCRHACSAMIMSRRDGQSTEICSDRKTRPRRRIGTTATQVSLSALAHWLSYRS